MPDSVSETSPPGGEQNRSMVFVAAVEGWILSLQHRAFGWPWSIPHHPANSTQGSRNPPQLLLKLWLTEQRWFHDEWVSGVLLAGHPGKLTSQLVPNWGLPCLSFPSFRGGPSFSVQLFWVCILPVHTKPVFNEVLTPFRFSENAPKPCLQPRLACNSLSSLGCLKVQASSLLSPEITGIHHQAWLSLFISLLHPHFYLVDIRFSTHRSWTAEDIKIGW